MNIKGYSQKAIEPNTIKFSELKMDKTFDESMKLLNQHSTEYEWFFTKLHNEWDSSIEETTFHSSFDFDTQPVGKILIEGENVPSYSYMNMIHQYSIQGNPVKLHSSFGDILSGDGDGGTYVSGEHHTYKLPGDIETGAIDTFGGSVITCLGGIYSRLNVGTDYHKSLFSATGQEIDEKNILTTGYNQRKIFLVEDYSSGTLKHYIIENTEFIEYSEISTTPNTLQIDYFPENLGEYLLGKDTIFLVPSDDAPMEYTLTTITGNCFIREIPSTVTSIQNYNPIIENFVLDISYLNITEIDKDSFSGTVGTVLVNYNTYNLLVSNNRIDGEESGSDHPILDNDRTIIRVVA